MAFIEKKNPVVMNIKLTSKGRELLSQGKLDFKYYAIGDSEVDYRFNAEVNAIDSEYTAFDSSILRAADKNPKLISFLPRNVSGDPYNELTNVPTTAYSVENQVESLGFFTDNNTKYIIDSNHVKQPDAMVEVQYVNGGRVLTLLKAPTYGTSGEEPAVGDLLFVKWTHYLSTTGHSVNKNNPTPHLFYRITEIISGTLASGSVSVRVDKNLPDFTNQFFSGGALAGIYAGAMIYYNEINFSGDTILNMSATDYLDESILNFLENSQSPTIVFPYWNMSIIYTEEIAGVQAGNIKYTQFNSRTFGGFVSYIQNQAPIHKKLGVIHYTNNSPANVYGESFLQTTPTLDIPTIMWHKSSTKTLGTTLSALGNQQLLTGLDIFYYDLADSEEFIVGKIFPDLKIFVIEDQELLFAMSYKSNRSWTIPDYFAGVNTSHVSCAELPDVVTNDAVLSTTNPENNATFNGEVVNDGGTYVIENGFVYSETNQIPTILDTKIIVGSGTGIFTTNVTTLIAKRTYYIRAYAINNVGVEYGEVKTIKTVGAPSVLTYSPSGIGLNSATFSGHVIDDGIPITAKGFDYGTTSPPTTSIPKGTGFGTFTHSIDTLSPATTYYVVAWAENQYGKGYGTSIKSFKTNSSSATLTTKTVTNIGSTTATMGGIITSDGGATITERGVVFATSSNPAIGTATKKVAGLGADSFTIAVASGLAANTTYYVRAYAINANGTSYGENKQFTTTTIPSVTTNNITTFGSTTATMGGNVTSDGNTAVTERGVVWATTNNPTTSSSKKAVGSGTGTFTTNVTGLVANTTYYVRAYAINSNGTSYGVNRTFKTTTTPSVTTNSITTFGQTTATMGGNVTSDGGVAVTERGVVYATSNNPTTSSNKIVVGSGTGTFTTNVTGLIANTPYYVRAYAINANGTSYGVNRSFTTEAVTPTVNFSLGTLTPYVIPPPTNTEDYVTNIVGLSQLPTGSEVTFFVDGELTEKFGDTEIGILYSINNGTYNFLNYLDGQTLGPFDKNDVVKLRLSLYSPNGSGQGRLKVNLVSTNHVAGPLVNVNIGQPPEREIAINLF